MTSTDLSERIPSGFEDLDEVLGGLMTGDNVVWVSSDGTLLAEVEDLLISAAPDKQTCVYVSAQSSRAEIKKLFGKDVGVIDAIPGSRFSDSAILEEAIIRAASDGASRIVIDGLESFAQRWGIDRATAFFRRVCPRLFDLGPIAYWRVSPRFRKSALEEIRKVTQCVFQLSTKQLRIIKAEGRPATIQGRLFHVSREGGTIRLKDERAQGRLAEGIQRLRAERHLSQADLAQLASVSASAISQAEAGQRGLSLETLLNLTSELGIGLDDLLENRQRAEYVLARRNRGPDMGASRFLLDDPSAGLRVYLVTLAPGERGTPPVKHKGAELILVARGLVLVDLGTSSPPVRAGDAILATRVPILSWRNLAPQRSILFWILRD
jgi:transcriptional regulator with XRE-family HTH domain